ncbi:MAG: hypothetical protein F6K23_39320 [Okeania sp. SIO2C9]|uniref:hypothetical protein n=1 Tax=Okeania sp. SIO2C9 TaxID=2607791 RepID=UPI0013BF70D9|nr:hypothetical protein [Okeania sp. SIO2C9]NEQ78515.1 hypothetical protein [Okeania sp. SIO2C9]
MSTTRNRIEHMVEGLEGISDAADAIHTITEETFSITKEIDEIKKTKAEFQKHLQEKAPQEQLENEVVAKELKQQKAVADREPEHSPEQETRG